MATVSKVAAPRAVPVTANESLALAYDDHAWTEAVIDDNTTPGIKRTLKAHAAAIQALADMIDGVHKNDPRVQNETRAQRSRNEFTPA